MKKRSYLAPMWFRTLTVAALVPVYVGVKASEYGSLFSLPSCWISPKEKMKK